MPKEWSDDQYEEEGKQELLPPGKSYEGRSNRSDQSDWRDFHLAVQRAAAAAAADLGPGEEDWLEVSRMRVRVGNPNVKIYSVFLTKTPES
jgi:hypothetical protein